MAATKTYTSSLMAISLLSTLLADDADMMAAIEQIPEKMIGFSRSTIMLRVAATLSASRACGDGRGYNYATAFELALKLKELTYTIAEPYSSADFLHGPIALIENGFPAIVVAPTGVMLPEIQAFIKVLRQREAEPIIISDDEDTLSMARIPLPLNASAPEWLSPLIAIVPGQLAMHLANARDYDPDHPRGLRKVTETR